MDFSTMEKERAEFDARMASYVDTYPPKEDKQTICDLLCKTLQATENASDIVSLTYDGAFKPDMQVVQAEFAGGGHRTINVTWDSGTAMIRDIMQGLGC